MALSSWDTLAFTIGGPSVATLTTPMGVTVEIYKNWLYVRDPESWRTGATHRTPVVMQAERGDFVYQDLWVDSVRGPQCGVFMVAGYGNRMDPKHALAGCGVYGWASGGGEKYIGVSQESVEFLHEHVIQTLGADDPLATAATWDAPLRYCQGDAAAATGTSIPGSWVGHADEPFMLQLLPGRAPRHRRQPEPGS